MEGTEKSQKRDSGCALTTGNAIGDIGQCKGISSAPSLLDCEIVTKPGAFHAVVESVISSSMQNLP